MGMGTKGWIVQCLKSTLSIQHRCLPLPNNDPKITIPHMLFNVFDCGSAVVIKHMRCNMSLCICSSGPHNALFAGYRWCFTSGADQ